MWQALERCHKGWGKSIIIGVAGAGEEISTCPFHFGDAHGCNDVPKIVDWYTGKIEIDLMITHTMPLSEINDGC